MLEPASRYGKLVVWAKFGSTWWPSRVAGEHDFPDDHLDQIKANKNVFPQLHTHIQSEESPTFATIFELLDRKGLVAVLFFGTQNYALIKKQNVAPLFRGFFSV